MHSSLLIAYLARRVMIDCGETWRGELDAVAPRAVVVTHAHPDHAHGLADETLSRTTSETRRPAA